MSCLPATGGTSLRNEGRGAANTPIDRDALVAHRHTLISLADGASPLAAGLAGRFARNSDTIRFLVIQCQAIQWQFSANHLLWLRQPVMRTVILRTRG